MTCQAIKNTLLTVSLCVFLLSSLLPPSVDARECSIIQVRGANGKIGHGFGVQTDGSVPRTGTAGDAGADATSFGSSTNPNPVCGSVAKIPGNVVNIATQTNYAVEAGVPLVYPNGSIPLTFFQVNRNGGGALKCEYSADGSGKSFQPMDVTLNVPGNFGIYNAVRTQYSAVATFKAGSVLTGGSSKNIGLVRCRAGPTGNCGGCFVVQMNGQVVASNSASNYAASAASSAGLSLTSQQMSTVVSKVMQIAKQQNLVTKS